MQPTPTTTLAAGAPRIARSRVILILVSLAFFGCRDPKIASYRVPKEPVSELPATAPTGAAMASASAPAPTASVPVAPGMAAPGASTPGSDSHGLQTAGGQSLTWTAPSTWQSKNGSSMRKATYVIANEGGASAELAISAFPGDVGGEVANVNRWRGQVGLEPVSDTEAAAAVLRLDVNALKIGVVDFAAPGSGGNRLIGAMVPFDGATWFFKLVGPDALVASAKPAFLEFVKTIKPAGAAKS